MHKIICCKLYITDIFMHNVIYSFLDYQLPEDKTWLCRHLFSQVFTIP